MEPITLRLKETTLESLKTEANEHGVSRSEYIRNLIQSRDEHRRLREKYDALRNDYELLQAEHAQELERLEARHEEELEDRQAEHKAEIEELKAQYEERIESLETENERLHRQLAATNKRVDQHTELVEYVQEERELHRRREERMDAPAWRRAKWWLLGRDRE